MSVGRFIQPASREELLDALLWMDEDSHIVAGCTDFLAERNGKSYQANTLVSLARMEELRHIEKKGNALVIGAMCTHAQIAKHPLVQGYFPALSKACASVGSMQIRNRATIGGNIVNASPAGDTIICAMLYGAQAVLLNARGEERALPVEEFITGIGKTALLRDEMLSRLVFPISSPPKNSCFFKLGSRQQVTISRLTLASSFEKYADGSLANVRLLLGSIAAKPVLFERVGEYLQDPATRSFEAFSDAVSQKVGETMGTRRTRPYKEEAVRGLAYDFYTYAINEPV
ncbi:FAD binding domain-containing protein [Christensenellaceae bacterium OttesenSCG-928-M15]|nr:FAD binding domain-containing protein [Christensenellaceae bacterium OttesenSCG-928-M15]